MNKQIYWSGPVPRLDDFDVPLGSVFYDAPTTMGPWAIMSHDSWLNYGRSRKLGIGLGQKYRKQPDGLWLCVEGGQTNSDEETEP